MTTFRFLRRLTPWAACMLPLLASGCGGGNLNPVHGQVYCEGKPAAGAVVFFHPLKQGETTGATADDPVAMNDMPVGRVGPDGSFEVSTSGRGRGAPAGRYAVTVSWTRPVGPGDGEDQSLLPLRYLNPATSGLLVDVKAGDNKLPPMQLSYQ